MVQKTTVRYGETQTRKIGKRTTVLMLRMQMHKAIAELERRATHRPPVLIHKDGSTGDGEEFRCTFFPVTETLTSKCCPRCGKEVDVQGACVFQCECGFVAPRDWKSPDMIIKHNIGV